MKKIVVLCSPTSYDEWTMGGRERYYPPLGLLLVAQTLKNAGYEIKFYDGNYNLDYKRDILDYISHNQANILFIGFYLALLLVRDCIDISKAIKQINLNIPIIVGGPFPSVFPNLVMKSGMIDVCCTGDGAKISRDIADCLANDKRLYNIPNIAFIDNDKIISNPRTQRDSLDSHNKIFYENFIDIETYVDKFNVYLTRAYDSSIKRAMPILTGLGCSYKCAFCENALLGHNHISLSAEDIIDQLVYYNKKFDIDSFSFFDENFFIDKRRLFKFLEILGKKDLKIKWGTQSRVNYFSEKYIDDKLLKELEKSGCVRLSMGVESGSPKMLKILKKGISPEQVIRAAEYGKNSSIYFGYDFMIDLPGETGVDVRMTFDLIYKLLSIKKNSLVTAIRTYVAYPGTPLSIEGENRLGYRIEEKFTFEQFRDLSLEKYNGLVNPQKRDIYKECIFYYYRRLKVPFQFRLNIKSIYHDLLRVIGLIRKRLGFYHLPLELFLICWLKSIKDRLRAL